MTASVTHYLHKHETLSWGSQYLLNKLCTASGAYNPSAGDALGGHLRGDLASHTS